MSDIKARQDHVRYYDLSHSAVFEVGVFEITIISGQVGDRTESQQTSYQFYNLQVRHNMTVVSDVTPHDYEGSFQNTVAYEDFFKPVPVSHLILII